MAVNRKIFFKGIKVLTITLPLLFIGPIIIHSAFKNKEHVLYYPVLSLGIMCCVLGMYLMFRGITLLTKGLFND